MSQRKKIVAGNWKMNLSVSEGKKLIEEILFGAKDSKGVIKIFFPSNILIPSLCNLIDNTDFYLGAQNCHEKESGAFTGEVSAKMIAESGCSYVIVGHSERRAFFHENNEQIAQKISLALQNRLKVIFCVGESLADRRSEKQFDTVGIQLHEVLRNFTDADLKNVVIAYEPVWAIGTGETATPLQAQEMHAFIRRTIKEMFGVEAALEISILYGGSCNSKNAKELFACADVDGGLIGGASLKSADFITIIQSIQ